MAQVLPLFLGCPHIWLQNVLEYTRILYTIMCPHILATPAKRSITSRWSYIWRYNMPFQVPALSLTPFSSHRLLSLKTLHKLTTVNKNRLASCRPPTIGSTAACDKQDCTQWVLGSIMLLCTVAFDKTIATETWWCCHHPGYGRGLQGKSSWGLRNTSLQLQQSLSSFHSNNMGVDKSLKVGGGAKDKCV